MPTSQLRKPLFGSVETRTHVTGIAYRAVWRAEGRKQTKTFDTHDEACDYLDEMAIKVRRGGQVTNVTKSRTLFSVYAEEWLAAQTKDVDKKRSYLSSQLLPAFGHRPLGEITRQEVQRWINEKAHDPSADCDGCEEVQAALGDEGARCRRHKSVKTHPRSTIEAWYGKLGQVMRAAQLDGYLPNGCPVGRGLHVFPEGDKRMVILTPPESEKLLLVTAEKFPAQLPMVHVASHTGLRIGELCGLQRDAYDGSALMVKRARKSDGRLGPTKTNRVRRVDLLSCCAEIIDAHLSDHDFDHMFPAPGGAMMVPTNWRKRHWYPIVEAAGLEDRGLHFHDLRHTHCSNLLAAGWEVTTVAERLGHKSAKMTLDVYGHALPGRQAALLREKGI